MTYPSSDVSTTDFDAGTDVPATARTSLLDLITKFNLLRNHISAFIQGFLSSTDASAARASLGAASLASPTFSGTVTAPNFSGPLAGNAATATSAAACSGNSATATKLSGDGGSAPAMSCRARMNFNGTGTAAVRNANNATLTDNGAGDYSVNFTTAMPDADYVAEISLGSGAAGGGCAHNIISQTASQLRFETFQWNGTTIGTKTDLAFVNVAIFR